MYKEREREKERGTKLADGNALSKLDINGKSASFPLFYYHKRARGGKNTFSFCKSMFNKETRFNLNMSFLQKRRILW